MTFNISLITMKKKPGWQKPYEVTWLFNWGSPTQPRISLSSALGSWFQDTARGLLIFKSRNLDQRQHLNSKTTWFDSRLSVSIRRSLSECGLGFHRHTSTSARLGVRLSSCARAAAIPPAPGAISPGKHQHPSPGYPRQGENTPPRQQEEPQSSRFLKTVWDTTFHSTTVWTWNLQLRMTEGFFFQGVEKERFTLCLLSELTFYTFLACKAIAVCKAAAFS